MRKPVTVAVAVSLHTDVRWRVRDCDAIRHWLCDDVVMHRSTTGPITGDDLLSFLPCSRRLGCWG